MQNIIFDSHAHYDDEAFEEDRHQVIQSLQQKGVCNVINVGANLERSKDSIALAAQYPFIYAAAGIHPAGKAWFLTKLSKQELDTLQQAGQQKDENEQEIEVLFQSFCRSLSILERQNQPLQQQLVPLKYRMHMTEFQKK